MGWLLAWWGYMVQLLTMCAKAFITYIRANVPAPNVWDWYISLASSALKHITAASPVLPFCFFLPHFCDPQFQAYQNWTVSPKRSSCDSNNASVSQDTLPTFYGTRNFTTVLTTAPKLSLSLATWPKWMSSQLISLRSTSIVSSNLRLVLPM